MLYSSHAGEIKDQEDRDLLTGKKATEEECGNDAEESFPTDNPFGSGDLVDIEDPKSDLNSQERRRTAVEVELSRVA